MHHIWIPVLSMLASMAHPASPAWTTSPGSSLRFVETRSLPSRQEPIQAPYSEAERLLEEVRAVYSKCKTYRDRGRVELRFVTEDKPERVSIKPFETVYVRGTGHFRFEYRSGSVIGRSGRQVVWSDGDTIRSWQTLDNGIRTWPHLKDALSVARGTSSLSSTLIPALLIDGMRSEYISLLSNPQVVGVEIVEGTTCARIDAHEGRDGPECTLWIDEERLIRKITSAKQLPQLEGPVTTVRSTITWDPVIGGPVPASAAEFSAPADAKDHGLQTPSNYLQSLAPDEAATELLESSARAYASCSTYRDQGTEETLFIGPYNSDLADRTVLRLIESAFDRSTGKFLLQTREHKSEVDWTLYAKWGTEASAQTWSSLRPQVKALRGSRSPLAGSGVPGGFGSSIPLTQFSESPERFLSGLASPTIVFRELVGDVPCTWIAAVTKDGEQEVHIWIDEKQHLIRKVMATREHKGARGFSTQRTITWNPTIDKPIPASDLDFHPPAAVGFEARAPAVDLQAHESDFYAKELLEEVRMAYANCSSYQDTGSVETVFFNPDRPDHTSVVHFESAFERETGKLRYESRERRGEYEWDRWVVWSDGQEYSQWTTRRPGVQSYENLSAAWRGSLRLAGAPVVSIPTLLGQADTEPMTPQAYSALLAAPWVAGSDTIGGLSCIRIEGIVKTHLKDQKCSLWIDKDRLVRKLLLVYEFDGSDRGVAPGVDRPSESLPSSIVQKTVYWHPQVNGDIPASSFGFEFPD